MPRPEWQRTLRPLADLMAATERYLHEDERTEEELRAMLAAAQRASTTNCWWATYRAAQLVLIEVPRVLEARRLWEKK